MRSIHVLWGPREGAFFGSSPNSGEGFPDFEEEIGVVSVSVGDALDDLNLVVDPLDQIP